MKKRLLSLLLTLVMILGMIPATALTAEAATVEITSGPTVNIGSEYNEQGYMFVEWEDNYDQARAVVRRMGAVVSQSKWEFDIVTNIVVSLGDYELQLYDASDNKVAVKEFTVTSEMICQRYYFRGTPSATLGEDGYVVNYSTSFWPKGRIYVYIDNEIYNDFDINEPICLPPSSEPYRLGAKYSDYDSTMTIMSDPFYVGGTTHTVTFKVDTTTVATKTVEDGKTVTAPADPTQSGKTFLGWYTADDDLYDFSAPVTSELYLYAKFELAGGQKGDVNNDGAIDQYDYILVKRHYFETRYLTDDEMTRADVNSDGAVNQYDYILIKRHYFGTFVIGG